MPATPSPAERATSSSLASTPRGLFWKLFREHPLFGVGWEQFGTYSNRELSPQVNAGSPHDDYLRMAAELGILGVLFLVTCLTGSPRGLVVKGARRLSREQGFRG